ncbi:Protein phosphatase PP2A regulatory subunit B [Ascosphaera pollenicola]|nr:Protein phosphatase PP2A regulatory subunit B [Ascosphaera pollenicola]
MDNVELLALVDDDAALRVKVDEAMVVYDEYMKNKGGEEGAPAPAGSGAPVPEQAAPAEQQGEAKEGEAAPAASS